MMASFIKAKINDEEIRKAVQSDEVLTEEKVEILLLNGVSKDLLEEYQKKAKEEEAQKQAQNQAGGNPFKKDPVVGQKLDVTSKA